MSEQDVIVAQEILRKTEGIKRKLSNCVAELNEVWVGASGSETAEQVSLAIGKVHIALESIKQAEKYIESAIAER